MTPSDDAILSLSDGELMDLASALRSGRVGLPPTGFSLARILGPEEGEQAAASLQAWTALGLSLAQAAWALELIVKSRKTQPGVAESVDLVLTGLETPQTTARDTAAVVHEMFAQAEQSVMVVGYAVHKGHRVFRALADRMTVKPELAVQMCLDIQPAPCGAASPDEAVCRFRQRFVESEWPTGCRLPQVFYYPPSLDDHTGVRSCLHAKCVVIDRRLAFVSSANFTEAAQERNIEAGILIRSPAIACHLYRYFDFLIDQGTLRRVL